MAKTKTRLILPPKAWIADGVKGICLGQCINSLQRDERMYRGKGIAWHHNAHAHNTMFWKGILNEAFGWICVQPDDKRDTLRRLGTIVDNELIEPAVLAYHEYAHILVPYDVYGAENRRYDGHGPTWQQYMSGFGYGFEADRYRLKYDNHARLLVREQFQLDDRVRIKAGVRPSKYVGQTATIVRMAPTRASLSFDNIVTNTVMWPYECLELVIGG